MPDSNDAEKQSLSQDLWSLLKLNPFRFNASPVKNANEVHEKQLSLLDKFAIKITDRIGSMGFFFLILAWTVIWCGYNILASEIPALHWVSFDPFPAFVAYLLMSNVIQILLMPLIMVGQNLQGRHAEIRAELDFEVNKKAEAEVVAILRNLERNTDLLIQLMRHSDCRLSDELLARLAAEKDEAERVAKTQLSASE